jgi:hypothetical protein
MSRLVTRFRKLSSTREFLTFLQETHGISPMLLYSRVVAHCAMRLCLRIMSCIDGATQPIAPAFPARLKSALHTRTTNFWKRFDLRSPLFVWAVSVLAEKAETIYARHGSPRQ